VTRGSGEGTGIKHGDELVRFVNAVLGVGDGSLDAARSALVGAVSSPGMIDAAGVISAFTMMNRVADCTGLPLDPPMEMASRALRAEIGTDSYPSATNTPKGGWWSGIGARILGWLLPRLVRLMGNKKG